MNKNTLIIFLFGIAVLTVGILGFIYFSNDHAECETYTEHSIWQNGERIATEKHVCKERFNL